MARGGPDYDEDTPSAVLDDCLKRLKEGEFEVKPPQVYQGSIFVWNAFRNGKTSFRDIKCDIRKGMHGVL